MENFSPTNKDMVEETKKVTTPPEKINGKEQPIDKDFYKTMAEKLKQKTEEIERLRKEMGLQ